MPFAEIFGFAHNFLYSNLWFTSFSNSPFFIKNFSFLLVILPSQFWPSTVLKIPSFALQPSPNGQSLLCFTSCFLTHGRLFPEESARLLYGPCWNPFVKHTASVFFWAADTLALCSKLLASVIDREAKQAAGAGQMRSMDHNTVEQKDRSATGFSSWDAARATGAQGASRASLKGISAWLRKLLLFRLWATEHCTTLCKRILAIFPSCSSKVFWDHLCTMGSKILAVFEELMWPP